MCIPFPPPFEMSTNMSIGVEGLCVRQTEASAAALRRAASQATTTTSSSKSSSKSSSSQDVGTLRIEEDLRVEAARYVDAKKVPFRLLKRVCEALRDDDGGGSGGDDDGGPWLQDLVRGDGVGVGGGGGVALEAPKRPRRNPELEARCQKLRDEMEQRRGKGDPSTSLTSHSVTPPPSSLGHCCFKGRLLPPMSDRVKHHVCNISTGEHENHQDRLFAQQHVLAQLNTARPR